MKQKAMKRATSLFNCIVSFENLRSAWLKARKGKTKKKAVKNFSRNVNANLTLLKHRLCENNFSSYVQFKVHDPKERIISVVPFSDRVMHHAIMNVLESVFERQSICHTYACRKGKGTHAAARYAKRKASSSKYFLKLDVKKYFDSIDHKCLKRQLSRIIKDSKCLMLLFAVIDSYASSSGAAKGLPIGNLTSQFFANFYLSSLDHFILERMNVCGYVRYMDDMVLFANSMEELKNMHKAVAAFCADELALQLKEAVFGATAHGVPFLGWRIAENRVYILQKTKRRMKNTLKKIERKFALGQISEQEACIRSFAVYATRRVGQ